MGPGKRQSPRDDSRRLLALAGEEGYECPACRHGQVQPMALMDTYACGFCRHIFEVNLDQQTIHVVDSLQPMGWRWLGRRWQPLHQTHRDTTLGLWLVGSGLVIGPAGLVALGGYVFPPLEAEGMITGSMVWALGTLAAHGTMVAWMLAEHHQFPAYVTAKIRLRRWLSYLPG